MRMCPESMEARQSLLNVFSMERGRQQNDGSENQYCTAALIGSVILPVPAWGGILRFEQPILTSFRDRRILTGINAGLYAAHQVCISITFI